MKYKTSKELARKKIFKVHCEFYVTADDENQVELYCAEDEDFVENHVVIEEVEEAPEKIYTDID